MEDTRIRREDDRAEFVIERRLGSGLLGVVYKANKLSGSETVAVKIPAPNLTRDQRDRFDQEYKLLRKLAEGKSLPNVPNAWKGRKLGDRSLTSVLLLEMAPPKLLDHLRELEGLEKERVAWEAGRQYATLLRDLHNAGYTCSDRKLGDFCWDVNKRRLVVLDWNAVRRKQDEGVLEDIQIFGGLWYQLLTQRYRPNMLDPLDETQWVDDRVTYGSRYLLKLLLDQTKAVRDEVLLIETINNWYGILNGTDWRRAGLNALEEAQAADNEINRQLTLAREQRLGHLTEISPFNLAAEEDALVRLDLARRAGDDEAQAGFVKSLDLVQRRGERYTHEAELAFRVSMLTVGRQALDSAEKSIFNPEAHPDLLLTIRRWQLLFHAASQAIRERRIDLRNQRESLAEAVQYLTLRDRLTPVQQQLSRFRDDWERLPDGKVAADVLDWFLKEIALIGLLEQAKHAEEYDSDYTEALARVRAATQLLIVSETVALPVTNYVAALKQATPFAGLHREHILQRKADNQRLRVDLKRMVSEPVPYTYLVQRQEELKRYFSDDAAMATEIEKILDAETMGQIGVVEYHHARANYFEMLTALEPLLNGGKRELGKLLAPFINAATNHTKKLLDAGKSDKAKTLITQLAHLKQGQTLWR